MVQLEAKTQHWVEDLYWEGTGNVKITYQDVTIRADWIGLDWQNKTLVAEGEITLIQGNSELTAKRVTYNLDEKTGIFEEATGSFDGMYQFEGEKIIKEGENLFRLENGLFTSCELDRPAWSFKIRHATIELEGYVYIRGISFRIRKLPLIYFPYLVWPAKRDRARGLLTPHFGHTFQRGSYLGLAYFLPIGDSYDLTFQGDYYSKGFSGGGVRFRYNPTKELIGEGSGYLINDDMGEKWWKFIWKHDQRDLPFGFILNTDIEMLSDVDFFREFERTFDRNTNRSIYSHITLSKNWGLNSLVLKTDHRKTVFSGSTQDEIVFTQMPEMEFRMRPRPLFSTRIPLYVSLDARAHLFDVDRGGDYVGTYGRLDLFPTLSTAFSMWPWLSIRPSLSYRATYYSKTPDDAGGLEGEAFTRTYQLFQTDIVGPSFSRIYVGKSSLLKHLIEPRISYQNLTDLDDRPVPIFDENDSIRGNHQVRYSIANRFFLKSEEKSAFEIASFELSQRYNIDDEMSLTSLTIEGETEKSPRSSLEMAFRFYPSSAFNLDTRASFHAITHKWETLQISGGARIGMQYANLIYFRTNPQVEGYPKQDQIRLYSGFKPFSRLSIRAQVNYDIEKHYPSQQRYVVRYTGSCYAIAIEYRDYRLGTSDDREYRITFDLKNVGSFLEITGGVDDLFGGTP